jgi:hypothetical protein
LLGEPELECQWLKQAAAFPSLGQLLLDRIDEDKRIAARYGRRRREAELLALNLERAA